MRPVVLGGLAARLAGARRLVLAPTGLGYLWTTDGIVVPEQLPKFWDVVQSGKGEFVNGTRFV